jgi:uncharacterized LabA/DUF88 family protein
MVQGGFFMMKVAVFLDYANINAAARQLNCNVDYEALLNYLADEAEERTLQAAYAYVPIDPRQEHAMDETISELWQAGYIVNSKVGTIAGESYKCDFDVEMALDISRIAYTNAPDIVVLVSGDGDFIPIVLDMRNRGIRVEVAAFDFAMSRQLTLKSSGFINLDVLIGENTSEPESFSQSEPEEESSDMEDINQILANVERERENYHQSRVEDNG